MICTVDLDVEMDEALVEFAAEEMRKKLQRGASEGAGGVA